MKPQYQAAVRKASLMDFFFLFFANRTTEETKEEKWFSYIFLLEFYPPMAEEHASDMLLRLSSSVSYCSRGRACTREVNQRTCGQCCEPTARLPDSRA